MQFDHGQNRQLDVTSVRKYKSTSSLKFLKRNRPHHEKYETFVLKLAYFDGLY